MLAEAAGKRSRPGRAGRKGGMQDTARQHVDATEALETREWLDSLDYVLKMGGGPARVARLLHDLRVHAAQAGVKTPFTANTPYINTISVLEEPPFPGSGEIERRIKSIVRWNAAAMVVKANRASEGIGGHISTYASAATLYEVGLNHFFKGKGDGQDGDIIYFQGHAAPGMYARAFVEGRVSEKQLRNFRRELKPGGGLSSYPHPWLMPEFWGVPHRVHGHRAHQCDLPGAVHALPGGPRAQAGVRFQGLGVRGRRRDRRGRDAPGPSRWRHARSSTT